MKLRQRAVVTTGGHLGKSCKLSGDLAWNYNDLAAAFSKLLGHAVAYQSVTPEQHLAALKDVGVPERMVVMADEVDAELRAGAMAYQNGDLARLIGRPTTPLVEGLRPLV
jgi:NAD(P)H dehydrogenase (quinone)